MRRFFISGLFVAGLVVLVGVGFLAWIGPEGGLTPVPPASAGADGIQQIYVFVGAFATLIFLVVTIPLVLFTIRFRRGQRGRDVEGPQIRGNTQLELAWTVIPVLILVAIAVFTFVKLSDIHQPTARAAGGEEPDLVVQVEGTMFSWRFVYPNGKVSFDLIRLPVDREIRLDVSASDDDVIHSFWVPALGGKMDAIPGRLNRLWLHPTRTGTWQGKCAELCGLQHSAMLFTAEVVSQEEFDAWLAEERQPRELGEEIFQQVCSKCHFAAPEYAPNIAGSPLLADAQQLRSIVRNGIRRMPAVGATWTDAEVDALVEFLGGQSGG